MSLEGGNYLCGRAKVQINLFPPVSLLHYHYDEPQPRRQSIFFSVLVAVPKVAHLTTLGLRRKRSISELVCEAQGQFGMIPNAVKVHVGRVITRGVDF